MWCGPYCVSGDISGDISENGFNCLRLSPEVWEHIGLKNEDMGENKYAEVCPGPALNPNWLSSSPTLVRLIYTPTVRQNCVSSLPDSNTASLHIRLLNENDPRLRHLTSVHLTSFTEVDSEVTRKRLLGTVVSRGQLLPLLRVDQCSPWQQGVISEDTDVTMTTSRRSSTFDYCSRLVFGKDSSRLFNVKEFPLEVGRQLCPDDANSTVVMNLPGCASTFCQLLLGDNFLFAPLVTTSCVPYGSIFASPSLLQHLRAHFGGPLKTLRVNLIQNEFSQRVEVAAKAEISFLGCPVYADLSSRQTQALLKGFFETRKYLFPGQIIELLLDDYNCCDEGLFSLAWKHPGKSIFFKIISLESDIGSQLGAYVNSETTTLFQKPFIQQSYPPRSTMTSGNRLLPRFCPILPPSVERVAKEIMKGDDNAFLVIGEGSEVLTSALPALLGFHLSALDCRLLQGDTSGATEARLRQAFSRAAEELSPSILLLEHVEATGINREGKVDYRTMDRLEREVNNAKGNPSLLIIGQSTSHDSIPRPLASIFSSHMDLDSTLDEAQRLADLKWLGDKLGVHMDLEVISRRTGGFTLADLEALIRKAAIKRHGAYSEVTFEEVEGALSEVHSVIADAMGAPKIPNVRWEDVGGLEDAKTEILDTIQMPLRYPELLKSGLKRSGVLMYGPPGVGKTLLAKAVATELSLNFLSVKGPELLNMYVGQSEKNVRAVFERARAASPAVVFFDELDALAPARGKAGDSGGVMDRVVSQLLAELDGMDGEQLVFVIGATNRPDLVDPALLRPGRFDRLVYLGIASSVSERTRVITSLTRSFNLAPDCTPRDVSEMLDGKGKKKKRKDG